MINLHGLQARASHQSIFYIGTIILFSFMARNIWLTLFLWWSVFLFCFFKFNTGQVYLQNIFLGSVVYVVVKNVFKKEHINAALNVFLWLVAVNLLYGILQVLRLDFIYDQTKLYETSRIFGITTFSPIGFMTNTGITAILYAFSVPILLNRKSLISKMAAGLMFLPIVYFHSFSALIGATCGLFFSLFFIIKRKWFIITLALSLLVSPIIYKYIDKPGFERISAWKLILKDCQIHPVTGWGMDSFRNYTEKKQHLYAANARKDGEGYAVDIWDNPHNLYISIFFEFGMFALALLFGYLVSMGRKFKAFYYESNTKALAGFLLVFLIVSAGAFPIFLGRCAAYIIPMFALFEIQTGEI